MPTDNNVLVFRCLNPECAKLIRVRRPAVSGIYPVVCPHCSTRKLLKLQGEETTVESSQPGEPTPESSERPLAGSPPPLDFSAAAPIAMRDDFLTGQTYRFLCPHCGNQEIGFKSEQVGHKEFACPLCKGRITADVRGKTKVWNPAETGLLVRGRLVMLRKGWFNKKFHLGLGSYTVGRYDESEMSDFSVRNDSGISRRSVRIDVNQTAAGFTFKMTVVRATNPVLHNNSELSVGESVYLNFGDSIMMGRTRFRFERDE